MRKIACITVIVCIAVLGVAVAGEKKPPKPPPGPAPYPADGGVTPVESWLKITEFAITSRDPLVFTIRGTAENFPDDTVISISMLFEGRQHICSVKKFVMKGQFEWVFNAGQKRYFSANYLAIARYKPKKQDPDLLKVIARKNGMLRAKTPQSADRMEFFGTEESRAHEIDGLRKHFRKHLQSLYRLYTGIQEQVEKFTPEDDKKVDKSDFKERAWREFLEKLRTKIGQVGEDHESAYGDYIVMRYPESSKKLIEICEALDRRSSLQSVRLYKMYGMEPPKGDLEKARTGRQPSNVYFRRFLFEPICKELDIRKSAVGLEKEEKKPKKKSGKKKKAKK